MEEIENLLFLNKKALLIVSIAILLDVLSGVIKASINHNLKSSEFRVGLMKKVLDYILILIGFCLDFLLEVNYVGHAVLYSIIAMEFYSVLENINEYIPLPNILKNVLDGLKKEDE